MFGAILWIFMQFLLETMSPPVALVSAPKTMPSLKMQPQMVVPVFIIFGAEKPLAARKAFLRNEHHRRGGGDARPPVPVPSS